MTCTHEIRYHSLKNEDRCLAFPCDAKGHVPMDSLTEQARQNYLYARATVGREFAFPSVVPHAHH
jgi:hypothetical protein